MCPRLISGPPHFCSLVPKYKMVRSSFWLLVMLASAVSALPASEGSRDLGYEPYDSPGLPEKWQLSTLGECGGFLRPLLTGLLIVALVKVPLLLLGKLLLVKVAGPLAVGAALLPLGLYAAYRGSLLQVDQGKPESRLFPQDCFLAAACNLGSMAPKTAVSSANWVMKMLEGNLQKEIKEGFNVSSYREAYMKGAASKSCSTYTCPYL